LEIALQGSNFERLMSAPGHQRHRYAIGVMSDVPPIASELIATLGDGRG
jgi:hypothetical protein